jgi:putative membrane protein
MTIHKGGELSDGALQPQVIFEERKPRSGAAVPGPLAPRVTPTAQGGRIVGAAPVDPATMPAMPSTPRRRGLLRKLAFTALITAFGCWLAVDLYLWISSAFHYGNAIGWSATAAVIMAILGVGAIIAHEMRSYLALKNVEINQQRLIEPRHNVRPFDIQEAIRSVIAEVPVNAKTAAGLEAFQRQLQQHHSPAQQIEIFSQTVMTPLDRDAEAIVRRASARAFGITAISPTAITDAIFFIACSIRMVREIAACYGHRPTALATAHLLRRLVVEAGKLGAVDLAGATLSQHLGGAIAERVATSAAESMYAAQRMARLGLVTMGMCRPVPFKRDELPSITSSLIGNLFAQSARPVSGGAG